MSELYDVAIIGGGPAGSTAAILLARQGRRVIVLERDKFPRFHIGESLLPYSMTALERLGIREYLDATAVPKHGGEVATACGTKKLKFYFKEGFRTQHGCAYQVLRSDFDKALLDRAAEAGAEVREETEVEDLTFANGEAQIDIRPTAEGASSSSIRARFVIDCSGRQSLIATRLKLKRPYPGLNKFSIFAHYRNVQRDEGIDAGSIRLVRGAFHWFWLIPINETITSVGLVLDATDFKQRKKPPEEVLDAHLNAQPVMRERMARAERTTQVHCTGDYSYRNEKLVGDQWLLAGDAAGFIDPIFSTGVFLALVSGERAADAVHVWLDDKRRGGSLLRRYQKDIRSVMDLYLRFVTAWYREEFIEVFTNPVGPLKLAEAINSVLAGNIGRDFSIWWRMQVFYLVVYLQRFFPLCPRLPQQPVHT